MDRWLPPEQVTSARKEAEERSRRAEYAEATRQALVDAARDQFARRGYAATSTEDIVQGARVTKGALYHHFKGKADLFRVVVENLEVELGHKIAKAASSSTDPWQVLVTGVDAFLDACLDPAVQRILLLEAPSVLGWETWREIEAQSGLGLTQTALEMAMDAGAITRQPVEPLAHMLLGALHEGALFIARAEDRPAARAQVGRTTARMLESLRAADRP